MNKISFFIFISFFLNYSFAFINSNNNGENPYQPKLRDNYDVYNYKSLNEYLFKLLFFENVLLLLILHNSI